MQNSIFTLEIVCQLNIHSLYNIQQPHSRVCPCEITTYVYTKSCTQIFIDFTHNCSKMEIIQVSFNLWMDKQTFVHLYNGILLSNRRELLILPTIRLNLKCKMLSEGGQIQKATYCRIPRIGQSGVGKTLGTKNRSVVAKAATGIKQVLKRGKRGLESVMWRTVLGFVVVVIWLECMSDIINWILRKSEVDYVNYTSIK